MPALPTESAPIAHSRYTAGDLIAGKYLLDRILGEGGMGSVWLAHNMDLDAPVAIKLVHSDVAPREAADRLKREARVEAQIEHRAIVRVFDCGETELGHPFIVMEHLEGMSFADALDKKGPLSPTSAVRILLPIVDGLSAAHEKGIVHRDIKPENIFLARGARHIQPKVVDFGIAKLDRWDPNPAITLQGTVIGSPSYMAPEQARGLDDVDHRSDIWAVCAVLYEAVTGSTPFRGDSYNAILRSIVEEEVAPLTNARGALAALWTVLARGLAKDREQRFQSMTELGSALAEFLLAHHVTEDVCGDSIASKWGVTLAPIAVPAPHRPRLSLVPPGDESPGASSIMPTSSGPPTLSHIPRGRLHLVLLPSLAALVLLGATGSLVWQSTRPITDTVAVAAPGAERSERLVANPVAAPEPERPSIVPGPSTTAVPSPLVRGTAAARPSDGTPRPTKTSRHGWPTPAASTPTTPRTPSPSVNIADLRQPAPRSGTVDAETLHALGLKAYR